MDLFQFEMGVGADYLVGCAVEVFVFNCYVDNSRSGSLYHLGTATDVLVCFDVRMIYFSFLHCSDLLLSFSLMLFVLLFLTFPLLFFGDWNQLFWV